MLCIKKEFHPNKDFTTKKLSVNDYGITTPVIDR